MSIPTQERIIETIREGVRKTIGVKAMAAEMDMAPSSLGNILNPYADRSTVKLGLEQAMFLIQRTQNYAALSLIASEFGYTLLQMASTPDKANKEEEMLDDLQRTAAYQAAIRENAPREVRIQRLAEVFDDLMQTETSVRLTEGQIFKPGEGWINTSVETETPQNKGTVKGHVYSGGKMSLRVVPE